MPTTATAQAMPAPARTKRRVPGGTSLRVSSRGSSRKTPSAAPPKAATWPTVLMKSISMMQARFLPAGREEPCDDRELTFLPMPPAAPL